MIKATSNCEDNVIAQNRTQDVSLSLSWWRCRQYDLPNTLFAYIYSSIIPSRRHCTYNEAFASDAPSSICLMYSTFGMHAFINNIIILRCRFEQARDSLRIPYLAIEFKVNSFEPRSQISYNNCLLQIQGYSHRNFESFTRMFYAHE